MTYNKTELAQGLSLPQYPRAAQYDPDWVLTNLMGPNALWLTEALTQQMKLQPGMRVLDLGCGKAISSIFLAKEFGVQVWATDLWIGATENWERIVAAGVQDQVFPIHAEAHTLPFAEGFFDAAVSLDAYQYFGTDDLYLGYYSKFIRSGGELGIISPGVRQEFEVIPDHLAPYWGHESWSYHSPQWWQQHWTKGRLVDVTSAEFLEEGWKEWLDWNLICKRQDYGFYQPDIDMLEIDHGRHLGFTRVVALKR
ncbi:SAM-dependent methyltransferase [Deinococcus oregonensis]|uniref:SAM-dependent methyltransferase n=1 Tax=Deinococcus oregonensis TaxID=1805970 RepID=A0ABV6AWZ9_9DEIO